MFTVPGLYHLRYGAGRGTEVRGGAAGQETWRYLQWGPGYGEVSRSVRWDWWKELEVALMLKGCFLMSNISYHNITRHYTSLLDLSSHHSLRCTHLIADCNSGNKFEFAMKWKIPCVRSAWFYESIKKVGLPNRFYSSKSCANISLSRE